MKLDEKQKEYYKSNPSIELENDIVLPKNPLSFNNNSFQHRKILESEKNTKDNFFDSLICIWDINRNFKCPIIGTCLDTLEHEKMLKGTGFKAKKLRPYQHHRIIMEHISDGNKLSRKIDQYLKNKYSYSMEKYIHLSEKKFMEIWQEGLKSGHIDDLLFVAVMRNNLSDLNLMKIFGEIHMMGHSFVRENILFKKEITW